MSNAFEILGLKSRIFEYMSSGEIVPEVRITFENFSNTGFVAKLASMQ